MNYMIVIEVDGEDYIYGFEATLKRAKQTKKDLEYPAGRRVQIWRVEKIE